MENRIFEVLCRGLGSVSEQETQEHATSRRYSPYAGYGYAGEWEDDNGLVYLRARYYSHDQGRFVSLDPYEGSINNPISLNRYAYAHDNPINNTDPSGLCASSDAACISAVRQLEDAHPSVFMYWPERVPGGVFTYPTLTPSPTYTPTPTLTPTNTPSLTYTPSSTFTPTPTLAVCPTPTFTSTPTGTPTATFTPTITPTPTLDPPSTGVSQLSSDLQNPGTWMANEVNIINNGLDLYVLARGGSPMFRVSFVRSQDLAAAGRTIGDNTNLSIHPSGSILTILLGDLWSSNLGDAQYGKWLVVHESNHAFLWNIYGTRQRYQEIGQLAQQTFVTNPSDGNVFPTQYAAENYDTGTEYLAEAMTGMVWDVTGQTSPQTQPHVYQHPVNGIVNNQGVALDDWIRQVISYFMP